MRIGGLGVGDLELDVVIWVFVDGKVWIDVGDWVFGFWWGSGGGRGGRGGRGGSGKGIDSLRYLRWLWNK